MVVEVLEYGEEYSSIAGIGCQFRFQQLLLEIFARMCTGWFLNLNCWRQAAVNSKNSGKVTRLKLFTPPPSSKS